MLSSKTDLIRLIERLVSVDTSDPDVSSKKLIEIIDHFVTSIPSIKLTLVPSRTKINNNVIITVGPAEVPGVVLSGHIDVVPVKDQVWDSDPFLPYVKESRLYGRGSCDMKSFVGCALALLPVIARRNLSYPVHLVLTCDEETTVQEAPIVIEKLLSQVAKPFGAIVGEPTMMNICTHHRSVEDTLVTIRGKSTHASRPQDGINAIYTAAELIQKIKMCQQDHQSSSWSTTTNIGTIQGGTSNNTVPEQCSFNFECRATNADENRNEYNKLVAAADLLKEKASEVDITLSRICYIPALELKSKNTARDIVQKYLAPSLQTHDPEFPGGTEAGFFSERGIDTVILGPGNLEQAHKSNEFIELEQIYSCYNFLNNLLCNEILE